MAADSVGATEWLEMGGEKKPLVMRELGCADGCGRQMGGENCADGCGRRGCKGVAGNGEKKPLEMSELGCADGCGREMGAENCADGCGQRGGWLEMGGEKKPLVMSELGCADGCRREMKWVRRSARTAADGVGAREWLEMGGEKKPLEICELGCADGCGRQMGGENCADGCGRHGCQGVAGNGWGEEAAGDQQAWLRTAADGLGARSGWKWVGRRSHW